VNKETIRSSNLFTSKNESVSHSYCISAHAGDISGRGNRVEVEDFLKWFAAQDYKYRIFIAGNHDFFFERNNAHGPAYEILDLTTGMVRAGCEDLLNRIKEVKPKIHLSGHIHEGYGQVEKFGTHFINASVLNIRYEMVNAPIIVNL